MNAMKIAKKKRRRRRRGGIDVELGQALEPSGDRPGGCGGHRAAIGVLLAVLCLYFAFFATSVVYTHMMHSIGTTHSHSLFDHFTGTLRLGQHREKVRVEDFSDTLPDDASVGLVGFER